MKNALQSGWNSMRKWVLGDDIGTQPKEKQEKKAAARKETDNNGMVLSRQKILDAICDEFEQGMQRLTTKHTLLFPFGYCIFLNPKDFSYFRQTFGTDANDAAKELHGRVQDIIRHNANYSNFVPLSTVWQFMFLPFTDGQVLSTDGGEDIEMRELPPGQCKVISTPLVEDMSVQHDEEDGSTILTVAAPSTTTIQKVIINPDALKDVDVISNYCFRVDYEPARAIQAVQKVREKITASLFVEMNQFVGKDGETTNEYQMRGNRLKISGQNAASTDGGVPVVRLNSTRILSPHVSLRRDPAARQFFITAHGNDVTLNDIQLTVGDETIMPAEAIISIGWAKIHFKAL